MPNGIFIVDKVYTFQELSELLVRAISTIIDEDGETIFSITDLLCLLRSINEYVPGEFEIHRTHSHYYKIVYKSAEEVVECLKARWEGFIE